MLEARRIFWLILVELIYLWIKMKFSLRTFTELQRSASFFVVLLLVLGSCSVVIDLVSPYDLANWYYVMVLIGLLLALLCRNYPKENLVWRQLSQTELELERWIGKRLAATEQVQVVAYWWNYTKIFDSYFTSERFIEHANSPKSIGTGNRDSGASPTMISVFVKVVDANQQAYLLYQELENWASIPPWPYALENSENYTQVDYCGNLRSFVDWLKEIGHSP